MRVSAYMCPNCVTPWKCNGPHIPESHPPEPTDPWGWWDLVIVFGTMAVILVSMGLFVVGVVVSVRVARALGWL